MVLCFFTKLPPISLRLIATVQKNCWPIISTLNTDRLNAQLLVDSCLWTRPLWRSQVVPNHLAWIHVHKKRDKFYSKTCDSEAFPKLSRAAARASLTTCLYWDSFKTLCRLFKPILDLMSCTMAVHVCYNSWYISLPSSAKQQGA